MLGVRERARSLVGESAATSAETSRTSTVVDAVTIKWCVRVKTELGYVQEPSTVCGTGMARILAQGLPKRNTQQLETD